MLLSWFKPFGQIVFSFRIQKFSHFFSSSCNCSVVLKVLVICSIKVNFAFLSYDLNSENVYKLELQHIVLDKVDIVVS